MTSFSKTIQRPKKTFFYTPQTLAMCSFDELDDNEKIGASIPIPGRFETTNHCIDSRLYTSGLSRYTKELHANNKILLSNPRNVTSHIITHKPNIKQDNHYIPPTNHQYNIANLMNLRFDALSREDYESASRFQQHINKLQ
jgi:hypothetical protein